MLCVALFSFVIVYYYRLKQLENMSFSLLGGEKKKEKKKNPYLPTLFFFGPLRQHNILFYALDKKTVQQGGGGYATRINTVAKKGEPLLQKGW